MKYEFELIVDGKLLARFYTKKHDARDAKFVANSLLCDDSRWQKMSNIDTWQKQCKDGRKCYLELVSIGIPE